MSTYRISDGLVTVLFFGQSVYFPGMSEWKDMSLILVTRLSASRNHSVLLTCPWFWESFLGWSSTKVLAMTQIVWKSHFYQQKYVIDKKIFAPPAADSRWPLLTAQCPGVNCLRFSGNRWLKYWDGGEQLPGPRHPPRSGPGPGAETIRTLSPYHRPRACRHALLHY